MAAWNFPVSHSYMDTRFLLYPCGQSSTFVTLQWWRWVQLAFARFWFCLMVIFSQCVPLKGICLAQKWSVMSVCLDTWGFCNHSLPPQVTQPTAPKMWYLPSVGWGSCLITPQTHFSLGTWVWVKEWQKIFGDHFFPHLSWCLRPHI